MDFVKDYLNQIVKRLNDIDEGFLSKAADLILGVSQKGKKVILAGNGGSAAIASHICVDLTKNSHVRAISFNDADLITCLANDYGYEQWLKQAIEFYADKGDAVILISSSGQSKNIINAGLKAKEFGYNVITLSGFSADNPLRKTGDINFWVDSRVYNIVESVHNIWLTAVVEKLALTNVSVSQRVRR